MTQESDITFGVEGKLGIVTLNRPKALNALTLDMIRRFDRQLRDWSGEENLRAVFVKGTGERAYCAGGDVRAIYDSGKRGEIGYGLTADFFTAEYRLNRLIHVFPKPYVAFVDGIAMGGGVGVSIHGSHRVATERTVFAMPETGIGLFPDIGGSWFLPRMPGRLGRFLGLTGTRIKAADCCSCGFATHFVPAESGERLEAALVAADWTSAPAHEVVDQAIAAFAADPGESALAERRPAIDSLFGADTLEAVLENLSGRDDEWARDLLLLLHTKAPLSLKVTFEQLRRGAQTDFDSCMIMEYRLSQALLARHDFYEGVRALLLDKDNAPRWSPASLGEVTPEMLEACFAPLGERDLSFDG